MAPQQILAQATCNPGAFEVADARDLPFLVHVTGHLDGGDELPDRDYEIAAPDEQAAGWAGLGRYLAEMARLN